MLHNQILIGCWHVHLFFVFGMQWWSMSSIREIWCDVNPTLKYWGGGGGIYHIKPLWVTKVDRMWLEFPCYIVRINNQPLHFIYMKRQVIKPGGKNTPNAPFVLFPYCRLYSLTNGERPSSNKQRQKPTTSCAMVQCTSYDKYFVVEEFPQILLTHSSPGRQCCKKLAVIIFNTPRISCLGA